MRELFIAAYSAHTFSCCVQMDPMQQRTSVVMKYEEPATLHSTGDSSSVESSQLQGMEVKDAANPQRILNPFANKQVSSPAFTEAPLHKVLFKGISNLGILNKREQPGLLRQLSKALFKSKSSSLMKYGLRCRNELHEFLQHRGCMSIASPITLSISANNIIVTTQELDSIVVQFHNIREKLEGGEWVTREV